MCFSVYQSGLCFISQRLERKWVLWHEFMKEYSSLGDWLRLAEKSADSPRSAHVLFVTAKEELEKFEVGDQI